MPWIVVTGRRTWRPRRGVAFQPGVYEVPEEIAEAARAVGGIWVGDTEPTITTDKASGGALTLEDVQVGPRPGVRVLEPEAEAEPVDEEGPRLHAVYPCSYCPARFPSAAARDRHLDMNHEAVSS